MTPLGCRLSDIEEHLIKQLASDPALRSFLQPISLALELIGVAIIVYGAIVTVVFLIRTERKSVLQAGHSQYRIKQQFTTRILTGLEFFIAGDVLKTIINPTLESLAIVGAIVVIRAALTYWLNRELKMKWKENNLELKIDRVMKMVNQQNSTIKKGNETQQSLLYYYVWVCIMPILNP